MDEGLRGLARIARTGDRGAFARLVAGVARLGGSDDALELLTSTVEAAPALPWARELLGALGVDVRAHRILRPVPCEVPRPETELEFALHGADCGLRATSGELDVVVGDRTIVYPAGVTPALLLELVTDPTRIARDLAQQGDEAAWASFAHACRERGVGATWWSATDPARGAELEAGPLVVRGVYREGEAEDAPPVGVCLSTVLHAAAPEVPLLVRRFPGRLALTAFDLRRTLERLARAATDPGAMRWLLTAVLGLGSFPGRITLKDDGRLARVEHAPDGGEASAWLGPWRSRAADVLLDLADVQRSLEPGPGRTRGLASRPASRPPAPSRSPGALA